MFTTWFTCPVLAVGRFWRPRLQRGPDRYMTDLPNVVLVHGAWADGSSWSAVIERLQAEGYNVTAPQFPMTALADNVARLRLVLARQNGPDDRRRPFLWRPDHDRARHRCAE